MTVAQPAVMQPVTVAQTEPAGETIQIRASHYWPPLGGVNCSNYVNGACISHMASGKPWQDHIGYAIACPPEWPFGTKLIVSDKIWECMDRGGAIQIVDGIPWIDFLESNIEFPYGSIVEAAVIFE